MFLLMMTTEDLSMLSHSSFFPLCSTFCFKEIIVDNGKKFCSLYNIICFVVVLNAIVHSDALSSLKILSIFNELFTVVNCIPYKLMGGEVFSH